MTQIPISEIPEEGLPLSYSEEAAELDLAVPGARFLRPIAVDLVLVKAAGEISAHGRIKTSVMCECVRCLSQFPVPLDILVATQFRPALPPLPPGESRMPSSACKKNYYQDDVVGLDDGVGQGVLLAIPFSAPWRVAGGGWCPDSGHDPN